VSQQYVIEFGSGERAILEAEDTTWLGEQVRQRPGPMALQVRSDDTDDTEGHWRAGPRVRVLIEGDEEVEGHAFAVHFPTAAEADAFRRRLLLAGVLAGTVAVGAAAGVGLANLPASDTGAGSTTTIQATDVNRDIGLMDLANAAAAPAAAATDVDADVGLMDFANVAAPAAAEAPAAEVPQTGGPIPR
jgi:hypothetical protein